MRAIDADTLITQIITTTEEAFMNASWKQGMTYALGLVETQPTIQLAEPKRIKGKWVGADTQCGIACSVCGVAVDDFCHSADYIDLDYEPNFCPNCGSYNGGEINDQ